MIRHIVLFNLKPEVEASDREALFNKMRHDVARIPIAKGFAIGKLMVPSEEWYKARLEQDFQWSLTMEFDTEADLYDYQKNQLHEELLKELAKRMLNRKVYDFVAS